MTWKTIEVDGVEWQIRAISGEPGSGETGVGEEILEFRTADNVRPPRRIVIKQGMLAGMNDAALRSAFAQARPIGGDYYGRPGKRMPDMKWS